MPELTWWAQGISVPRWSARDARTVENLGFDGYTFNDSQCLGGDPFVAMMAAAATTSTLTLATSVTNPVTRDASVMAAAAASVHGETRGRVVLGIGRGDSSLAHIGLAPAPVEVLRRYVHRLRALLRGEAVEFSVADQRTSGLAEVGALGLKNEPTQSRLTWLRPEIAPVPVVVTATGPKMLQLAAETADGVNVAVGADPERIAWAVRTVRESYVERADGKFVVGAYVSVVVDEDVEWGRSLIAGDVASFARFSTMHGTPVGPVDDESREVLARLRDTYDMSRHFQQGSPQSASLSDRFIDRFAIVGHAGYCIDRLQELTEAGVGRFIVQTTPGGVDRTVSAELRRRFAAEVMPAVRVG